MGPKLGLCCIALDVELKFRTMTIKRFKELDEKEAMDKLGEICLHNISVVSQNVKYCAQNGFANYRIPSNLFPVLSYLGKDWQNLPNAYEIKARLSEIGPLAFRLGVGLSMHPDQFVCLGSPCDEVRNRSIAEFIYQGNILQSMGAQAGTKAPMCLHVSNGSQPPEETIERFMRSVKNIPEYIRDRIVLENEDKGCWNAETLFKTFGGKFPLSFDCLHDSINPSVPRDWCRAFAATWPTGTIPVFHWSEGEIEEGKEQRSHAEYFTRLPDCVKNNRVFTWECEVKAKDRAIKKAIKDFFS